MKKHERKSLRNACCALLMGLGCAALAPLGCSDSGGGCADAACDNTGGGGTGGTGGSPDSGGGTGGSGGSTSNDASGAMCGGIASIRCPEPNTTYCDYDDKMTCGQGDIAGICMPRPGACPKDCPGVCGCDGKFYCNACEAHAAGTDDAPTGSCSDASTRTAR